MSALLFGSPRNVLKLHAVHWTPLQLSSWSVISAGILSSRHFSWGWTNRRLFSTYNKSSHEDFFRHTTGRFLRRDEPRRQALLYRRFDVEALKTAAMTGAVSETCQLPYKVESPIRLLRAVQGAF